MKKILRYFLQGLLYIAPVGVTIYILFVIFSFIDGLLNKYIEEFLHFSIPGLGILIIFLLITLLGFFGQSIVFKPITILIDRFMTRAPLVKVLYSSIKDLLSAFVGKEKKFNQPVLVRVNTITNLEKIGFLTQNDLSHLEIKGKAAVYFPHSYNFSGELFIVPVEHITPLNIPASEAMKFIVSGGVTNV